MRYVYLFIFLITLASCSKQIITTTKTVEKDSVHVDTVKTKKIVKTKGDSAGIKFNLSEITQPPTTSTTETLRLEPPVTFTDDPVVFHKQVKTGHLTETVDITKKGNVKVTCKEDSLQHVIDNLKITIQKFKTTTTTTQAIKIEHKPTQFDLFCRGFTIAIFIVIALLVLNKFKKFIPWIP